MTAWDVDSPGQELSAIEQARSCVKLRSRGAEEKAEDRNLAEQVRTGETLDHRNPTGTPQSPF